jgi:hypothetical protein
VNRGDKAKREKNTLPFRALRQKKTYHRSGRKASKQKRCLIAPVSEAKNKKDV